MKRLLLIFILIALALPVAAQDMGSCNDRCRRNPPLLINMIGWTYPIIDFYADELEACNAVDNIDVNTQLLDSGSAHDQLRLALGTGGTSPYDIIMVTEGDIQSYVAEGWMMPLNDLIDKYEGRLPNLRHPGHRRHDSRWQHLRFANGAEYPSHVLPP